MSRLAPGRGAGEAPAEPRQVNLTTAIKTYFLRMYAVELARPEPRRKWGHFREAVFQTVWIVTLPVVIVTGTALFLLLATSFRDTVAHHRVIVELGLGVIIPVAVYSFVRRLVQEYEAVPEAAAEYGTDIDRRISKVQFQIILFGSIAWPFVIVGLRKMLG